MKFHFYYLFFIIIHTACGTDTTKNGQINHESNRIEIERKKLKKIAMCSCILFAYPDSLSDLSSSEMAQHIKYDFRVGKRLSNFTRSWLKKLDNSFLPPKSDGNFVLLACFDFYESKELDDFVKQQDELLDFTE